MQLMQMTMQQHACMQGLSTPFDIPWAIENAVMALALDPLLLGRWLQHTARHLWQVVRCTAFQRMVDACKS